MAKKLFTNYCHDLNICIFNSELIYRVNRAIVSFISSSHPKKFVKGYIGDVYAYKKEIIDEGDEVIIVNTEDDRACIPRFPEFCDNEDGVIADDYPLVVDRNNQDNQLVLDNNNNDNGQFTSSGNIISRDVHGFNPNAIDGEISTLEENSIESGITICNDHSQEQQVKPKRRWKKSEESEDEDYVSMPKRKKNLYY